jgi:multidrug efflux pump subunit AcrA (membrane-fusion protein)
VTGLEILGAIGTGLSAVGAIAGGISQSNAQKAQAEAAERQAQEARAASQREAIQRSKEARLVLSRQQALASASGGGATDTTVLDLMGKAASQGAYNTASAIYEGEAQGRGLEDQAGIYRMQARQAKLAGFINAGSTILSGVSGFAGSRGGFTPGNQMPNLYYGRRTPVVDPWLGLR